MEIALKIENNRQKALAKLKSKNNILNNIDIVIVDQTASDDEINSYNNGNNCTLFFFLYLVFIFPLCSS